MAGSRAGARPRGLCLRGAVGAPGGAPRTWAVEKGALAGSPELRWSWPRRDQKPDCGGPRGRYVRTPSLRAALSSLLDFLYVFS